jgi:hypothetical protein
MDVYPSVYVRELWDKIHKEAGIEYNSDSEFFQTDYWKNLLIMRQNSLIHGTRDTYFFPVEILRSRHK